jgi:hypothetical protein
MLSYQRNAASAVSTGCAIRMSRKNTTLWQVA